MPKVGVRSALLNILDLKTMLSGMSHYLSLSLYLFSKTTYNFLMFLANSQARETEESNEFFPTSPDDRLSYCWCKNYSCLSLWFRHYKKINNIPFHANYFPSFGIIPKPNQQGKKEQLCDFVIMNGSQKKKNLHTKLVFVWWGHHRGVKFPELAKLYHRSLLHGQNIS